MSKKLLNEAAVRRFMGLAGMEANIVSNTVTEMYSADDGKHEEEEMAETVEATTETVTEEEELEGEEDLAPVADAEDEMMGEPEMDAAPEMEITSEEAEVLANVLQKLMAAKGDMGAEAEMDMDADVEMADDAEVAADEEDAGAMMETEEEMGEDEIVQEVARRVAARILKAKKAQKEMNEALGK